MLEIWIVVLWVVAITAAIGINLMVKPEYLPRLLGVFVAITLVGGLIFYGIAFYELLGGGAQVVVRTIYAGFRIMIGENDYGDIADAAILSGAVGQILYWLIHLLGLMTTAGAAIAAIGSSLIRNIRLHLYRSNSLSVVYGVGGKTVEFGRELMEEEKTTVVYVDRELEEAQKESITEMHCIIRSDRSATETGPRFLRSIGMGKGKRKLRLYALSADASENERYAAALLARLQEAGVMPEQTALTILTPDEDTENSFLAMGDRYGYGSVIAINEPEMAARLLVNRYPPCDHVAFDELGRAKNDFSALIVGFGQVGQTVLRLLVMNGQFEGSTFHGAVFARGCMDASGRLSHQYQQMLREYDISFHENDGKSREIYDYIHAHKDSLSYVVLCTENEALDLELEQELRQYFRALLMDVGIYRVSRQGVVHKAEAGVVQQHPIYCRDILCSDRMDRMAMVLNHSYCGGPSPEADWKTCDYFSRMSSRASADFSGAMLRSAGMTQEDVLAGKWAPEGELLENLSKTEHLRWNAFHFAMGFSTMPRDVFEERAAQHRKEKEETGAGKTRIGKDLSGRLHACLIDWDELDELSQRENAVTGGNVDYKESDRKNVRAMGQVIRACLQAEEQS